MLHLLSYERTSRTTELVADFGLRQFTAKAKEFSAECNIHVFGEIITTCDKFSYQK